MTRTSTRASTRKRRIATAVLAMLGVAGIALWATRDGRTPDAPPGGIAWMGYVPVNGLLQRVVVRGEDRTRPALLWLHGGPGSAMTPLFRHYAGELERHFVVVYWDQRGAGRTLRYASRSQLTGLDQIVDDLDGLLAELRTRFGIERPWLVGHSWGSALGILHASRRPDTIAGVIGVNPVSDWAESDRRSYRFTVEQARAAGDEDALETLAAMGPPPWSKPRQILRQRIILGGYMKGDGPSEMEQVRAVLGQPTGTWLDPVNLLRGNLYTLDRVLAELQRLDLTGLTRFEVPIAFFLGRYDRQLVPELAAEWHETIEAPRKEVVCFDAAHGIPFERPERFVEEVLRVTRSEG